VVRCARRGRNDLQRLHEGAVEDDHELARELAGVGGSCSTGATEHPTTKAALCAAGSPAKRSKSMRFEILAALTGRLDTGGGDPVLMKQITRLVGDAVRLPDSCRSWTGSSCE
jgi:hypothetical protein